MSAVELYLSDARAAFRMAADANLAAGIERYADRGREALRLAHGAAIVSHDPVAGAEARPSFWTETGVTR